MKRYKSNLCFAFLFICISSIAFISCNNNICHSRQERNHDTIVAISNQLQEKERITMQDWGFEAVYDTISFFGKPIVMDDWTSIHHQIRVIASENDMLNYATDIDLCVLSIGDVGFGVNIDGDGIHLIASIQPDDPKMRRVIDYLNSIYGEPEEDDSDCYCWRAGANGGCTDGMVIRLRPLHSEEGGTVLFFG